MTIRILYQFATAKQNTDLGMAEVMRRKDLLNRWADADVEVEVATPADGPGSIESDYDAAIAVPAHPHLDRRGGAGRVRRGGHQLL